ncbi:MAG TPA: 16S rRNA (guanine(966)-N(2))-methyltransferase RsmD [Steroidobacteraceae bacterium]|nr:16S rRNA (guanine(966)-N(2))-methyltransferase RsmD [Steroidobacteraceae bacterium]
MKRSFGELRIIGGALRGRKWRIPDAPGLRPTPDRVRETLFNWLAPHIAGMRVLDLFAGSGALAFESLSRGAASAVLAEQNAAALAVLRETVTRFGLAARVERSEALAFLRSQAAHSFDLVFLDPPFDADLLAPALRLLGERRVLAPGGFCYVECAAGSDLPGLPAGWTLHRSGKAGEVGYHLLHAAPSDLPRDL